VGCSKWVRGVGHRALKLITSVNEALKSLFHNGKCAKVECASAENSASVDQLADWLYETMKVLADDFAQHIAAGTLDIKVLYSENAAVRSILTAKQGEYKRIVAYTPFWAISARGRQKSFEIFLLPTTDLHNLQSNEVASTLKLRVDLRVTGNEVEWLTNGLPVTQSEIGTIIRSLFKDMITKSKGDYEVVPEALRLPLGPEGQSLAGSVRDLISQKHKLIQKIVNQQEELQIRWARDLHDAVIGNVMALKRSLATDKPLDKQQVMAMLDEINDQLRSICHELTPRDLKDCGLQVVLEDLVNRLGERTGADCLLDFPDEIQPLPDEVQLHIYRIVQECFNNIEKHADATRVYLRVKQADDALLITVEDNGKGFDLSDSKSRTKHGGMGASTLKERTALINEFYPAGITIDTSAEPDQSGTRVTLKIELNAD
jgi:signal transduction histidine kinase